MARFSKSKPNRFSRRDLRISRARVDRAIVKPGDQEEHSARNRILSRAIRRAASIFNLFLLNIPGAGKARVSDPSVRVVSSFAASLTMRLLRSHGSRDFVYSDNSERPLTRRTYD
jgi:hypothetical protein